MKLEFKVGIAHKSKAVEFISTAFDFRLIANLCLLKNASIAVSAAYVAAYARGLNLYPYTRYVPRGDYIHSDLNFILVNVTEKLGWRNEQPRDVCVISS